MYARFDKTFLKIIYYVLDEISYQNWNDNVSHSTSRTKAQRFGFPLGSQHNDTVSANTVFLQMPFCFQ